MTLAIASVLTNLTLAPKTEFLSQCRFASRSVVLEIEVKQSVEYGRTLVLKIHQSRLQKRRIELGTFDTCEAGLVLAAKDHLFVTSSVNRVPTIWKVDLKRGPFIKGRFNSSDSVWKKVGPEVLFLRRRWAEQDGYVEDIVGVNIDSYRNRVLRTTFVP